MLTDDAAALFFPLLFERFEPWTGSPAAAVAAAECDVLDPLGATSLLAFFPLVVGCDDEDTVDEIE